MAHCLDDITFQLQSGCLGRQNSVGDGREHCVHRFSQFRQLSQEIGWPVSRARARFLENAAVSRIEDSTRLSPVDSIAPGGQSIDITLFTSAAARVHEVKDQVPAHARVYSHIRFLYISQYNPLEPT
jgi:hypothetical protein